MDQDQQFHDSQIENSQVQLGQSGRDTISFQNSTDNQVTINNIVLRLFGQRIDASVNVASVDWDWARRLLEEKQLPEIRKRLIDTLGRDRALMQLNLDEQPTQVGRVVLPFAGDSPLEPERRLQVQGEDQGLLDLRQMLITTFGRDDIKGRLLILGAPGAGKTTALLSLAEQLVCGALDQPKTVIPVLFELSTWRKDDQSIRDWLIEQLYDLHGGNRKAKLYEPWLDQRVLLPLLDGLDELGLERQRKCTVKLNEFAKHYPQLVVCCRSREFEQVNLKLSNLNGAICLEPLSDGQIQAYLEAVGRPQLWAEIQINSDLQNLLEPTEEGDPGLLRVPLFVMLAASTYDPEYPFQTKAELLDQYVARQLSIDVRQSDRRNDLDKRDWAYPTPDQEPDWRQTLKTLSWIARQLQQNYEVELLIEQIQPSWLGTQPLQRCYRVITGLIIGLITGLISGLISGLITGLSFGLSFGLISGLISGLILGLSDWSDYIRSVEAFKISMLREVRRETLSNWEGWLIFCSIVGLIFKLIFNLMLGATAVLIFGLIVKMNYALIVALKQNLQLCSRPNQGIWNSLKSVLWTTLLLYPLCIVCTGTFMFSLIVSQGINQGDSDSVIFTALLEALPQFLLGSIFVALYFSFFSSGGLSCIQHLCLRFVLWQSGIAPWNLARFLNYCVERRLLQRVGGRYRFLHRELLDYFAPPTSPFG